VYLYYKYWQGPVDGHFTLKIKTARIQNVSNKAHFYMYHHPEITHKNSVKRGTIYKAALTVTAYMTSYHSSDYFTAFKSVAEWLKNGNSALNTADH
jgi:hypothetical protein